MKFMFTVLLALLSTGNSLFERPADSRYFELRIYYCNPGKLEALQQRFQNHTTRLFEKHGMENIGYWVPVKNDGNALYYILAYPDKHAQRKSWESFQADPEWKEVLANSEKGGKIIDSIATIFMNPSDILPAINAAAGQDHVYELRTYSCLPERLPNLITRFKDHTVKLFEGHGMENIAYFTSVEADNDQPKLIYLLAHKSQEAATKSWAEFRSDPKWLTARDASEKDGKIVEKVESIYMTPLSFSKLR